MDPVTDTVTQGGLLGPPESNRGGTISLATLIDFIVQRTYHELTVLAELLPRKTDMERKIEIYNFAARTRQLFTRLLALVKWANTASKESEESAKMIGFLDKQSQYFVETADMLSRVARETVVHSRLPNFQVPAAVEVLTTGTYGLPACIRDKIVPPDPISRTEERNTLSKLNQVIQQRLVTGNLPLQMTNCKVGDGRVTFIVQHEFKVSLTLMGDEPNIPWRLLEIDILVEDGDEKTLVHSSQLPKIHQLIQSRLVDNPQPLAEVYNCLHFFCQSLQLDVLLSQTLRLMHDRLEDHLAVDEYIPGKCLTVSYWRISKKLRSELDYRLRVQVDDYDPTRPLAVLHFPSLESEIVDVLSMERLLGQTIDVRTRRSLSDLKLELQEMLKGVECTLQGSPAILSVKVLQPCLSAEHLLITVDSSTGKLQCIVPEYESPLIPKLNNAVNGDHSKLATLVPELGYWLTQKRCEKTLQDFPATAYEILPLLHDPDHPITNISRHRMYVKLHRHPNVVLIIEFKEVDCSFYILIVKPTNIDDNPDDDTTPKLFLKVQSLIEFDTFVSTNFVSPPNSLKRRIELARIRARTPYFMSELAQVIIKCDEGLPGLSLANELTERKVFHQGLQEDATGLVLKLTQLPPPTAKIGQSQAWDSLMNRLLSASIRILTKGTLKSWIIEFVFFSAPLSSTNPKEQGLRRPIYFQYDMATLDNTSKTVEALISDWGKIVHLYTIVYDLSEYLKDEKYNFLANIFSIKSYKYSELILGYGPDKKALVSIKWNTKDKVFKLRFTNAHSLLRQQLEAHLKEHRNLAQIIQMLHETYEPVLSIGKLVQTFTIMARSPTLIHLVYQGKYWLELRIHGAGLVTLRDVKTIQGLKTFLSKYQDETNQPGHTYITHKALETLCCPSPHPQGFPGPKLSPLQRFLDCVHLREQLLQFINTQGYMTILQNPSDIHFKVGEVFQCFIGLNPQHLQSLHLKITGLQDFYTQEDLQILSNFFDTRVDKTTSMSTFCVMLRVPPQVLKDFIQIMKLELLPNLAQQQGLKWTVQWLLQIPPSATPIAPTGLTGVLFIRNKILFFLQINRIGVQNPSIVLPLIYDIGTNVILLAEKREQGSVPALQAASQFLKQFRDFHQANIGGNCSVFPAIRDLLVNLTVPSEPQQQGPEVQMQMGQGQPRHPVNHQTGMMGPQ